MLGDKSVEAILGRLMPAALSETAEQEIGGHLDELALETLVSDSRVGVGSRWYGGTGLAAAIAITGALFWYFSDRPQTTRKPVAPLRHSCMVKLSHSDSLESVADEGWWEDSEGNAHQALHLRMVAHHELMDKETGIRMTVTEPREETIFLPVNTF